MPLTALVPVLWTENITASIDFYCRVLAFRCVAQTEGWACLERDGVEVMLSVPNAHEPYEGPRFSGSFYFRCDDVDAWWERLKEKAPVVYPIEDFDYGMREFAVRDNNGYILQFGKSLEETGLVGDEPDPLAIEQKILSMANGLVFEMNNCLMGVIGYADLIQEQLGPNHPVAEHGSQIQKNGEYAKKIVGVLGEHVRELRRTQAAIATRRRPGR